MFCTIFYWRVLVGSLLTMFCCCLSSKLSSVPPKKHPGLNSNVRCIILSIAMFQCLYRCNLLSQNTAQSPHLYKLLFTSITLFGCLSCLLLPLLFRSAFVLSLDAETYCLTGSSPGILYSTNCDPPHLDA